MTHNTSTINLVDTHTVRRLLITGLLFAMAGCGGGGGGGGDGDAGWGTPGGTYFLPRTGQTTVYSPGDDGDTRAGVAWPSPRFTDTGDGTVKDRLTGLVWLKDANCMLTQYSGQDTDGTKDGAVQWHKAINFVVGINNLGHPNCGATYTDWRLPNINELNSLLDNSRHGPALPLGHPFTNVQGGYWSSTTYAMDASQAKGVDFQLGGAGASVKTDVFNVWPVRGTTTLPATVPKTGQTTSYQFGDDGTWKAGMAWPVPRFTDNGDGSITDDLTDLVWLTDANCIANKYSSFDADATGGDGAVTWQHALDFVTGINNGAYPNCGAGKTDWRLPNRNELLSLIHAGIPANAAWLNSHGFINIEGSTGVTSDYYWTSTTDASNSSNAWTIDIFKGLNGLTDKNDPLHFVWPVRKKD